MTVAGVLGNVVDTVAEIGFGSNESGLSLVGGNVVLTGLTQNLSFSMPRNGTLTGLSVFLSVTASISLLADINFTVQVYQSTTPNNVFSPIPGAEVTITIPGSLNIGDVFNGTATFSEPVSAGTRLILVASATSALAVTLTGSLSAGLAIS
jgi:BclB C-terminal domain-containing protein